MSNDPLLNAQPAPARAARPQKLTDLQVRNLRPQANRYLKLFGDGFGVRVSPSGQKTFVFWFSYRGKKQLLTLGRYPAVPLKEALAKHATARNAVLRGENPAAADRDAPTVSLLVEEFEREVLANQPSGAETLRQINKDILPRLGATTPLKTLHRRHAVEIVDAVRERGPRIGNSAATILVRLGNFAVDRGLLDASPFTRLKKARVESRTRVLADWELARFVARIWTVDVHPVTALALLTILVTGQRPGEVAGLRKDELNERDALWTIPATRYKTGHEQVVPLAPLALELIRAASAFNAGVPYVFPSPQQPASSAPPRCIDRHSLSRAVVRKLGDAPNDSELGPAAQLALGLAPFTPHDLRRTCRTGMAGLGVPDAVAERVIGHKLEGMLAVYNVHSYLAEKRDALNRWAEHLASIMAGPRRPKSAVDE